MLRMFASNCLMWFKLDGSLTILFGVRICTSSIISSMLISVNNDFFLKIFIHKFTKDLADKELEKLFLIFA